MAATVLKIRVIPGARSSEVVGWLGDALKVRLKERAEKNQANAALITLLAKVLDIPSRNIRLYRGHRSSNKQILIEGIDEQSLVRLIKRLKFG